MRRATQIALLPLLLAQAIQTRRRALILPEPDGPRQGQNGTGPRLRLLILGDSSGAGVGVSHQTDALSGHLSHALHADFRVDWQVLARTGATTSDALDMLAQKRGNLGPIDVAVIALGVNDVTRLTPPRRWARQQTALINRLTTDHQTRLICLTPVPPMDRFPLIPNPLRKALGHRANMLQQARISALSRYPQCQDIPFDLPLSPTDMAADGFHPGPKIYRLWAEATAHLIRTNASVIAP